MAGLAKIKLQCEQLGLNSDAYIAMLRRILKVYGKNLKCTPIVNKLLDIIPGYSEEKIITAIKIYERKRNQTGEAIHPNYFITVLTSKNQNFNSIKTLDNENLIWGKII